MSNHISIIVPSGDNDYLTVTNCSSKVRNNCPLFNRDFRDNHNVECIRDINGEQTRRSLKDHLQPDMQVTRPDWCPLKGGDLVDDFTIYRRVDS